MIDGAHAAEYNSSRKWLLLKSSNKLFGYRASWYRQVSTVGAKWHRYPLVEEPFVILYTDIPYWGYYIFTR